MNDREKVITDFTKKIREAETVSRRLQTELGSLLIERNIGTATGYGDLYVQAVNAKVALEKSRSEQDQIKKILERKGEIKYRLRQVSVETEAYEKENSQSYKAVGEAVYQAYNSGYITGERFASMFAEAIKQIVELRKAEREIEEIRRSIGKMPMFDRLIEQGRLAVMSGNKAVRESAVEREFWKAGKEICNSDLLDAIEYPPVRELAATCIGNRKKIRDAEELKAALAAEDDSLTQELDGLDAGRTPQRKLQELEGEVHGLQESYRAILASVGGKYHEDGSTSVPVDAEIERVVGELEIRKRDIASYRAEIDRNNAILKAETLSGQIGEMERKVKHIEQQIEKSRSEAENLKAEIERRQSEKNRLDQFAAGNMLESGI